MGNRIHRRDFTATLVSAAAGLWTPGWAWAADRPGSTFGVASGDVTDDAAVVWSRCDRPARMVVEYATTDAFRDARRVAGPLATAESDFTAKVHLTGLPAGQRIFYRVRFEDPADAKVSSPPAAGSFRTGPRERADVFFAWSGDTAGQGYGINPDWGGMKIYEAIRRLEPHFFVHSGDHIYADNPIQENVRRPDGKPVLLPDGKTPWKNLVTPAKDHVAQTLADFRGNFAYNLLDDNLRRFQAEVPLVVQWDDHEVLNNWYPGETLDDARYAEKDCSRLAARARQAFFEYLPIRLQEEDRERIYRAFSYGPSLELFVLDQRSYRGPNSANRQRTPGPETAFMGAAQLDWLKRRLRASRATWKVVCSDMPIGLIVADGQAFENAVNGDPGPPLGRELEFADLLVFLRREGVKNVVWLTADVHYAAAHYYDPERAGFQGEFDGFWEFVAGPLNAGTFGPGRLDATFGPQVKFQSVTPGMPQNRPPSDGFQFFGTVRIDGRSALMTVRLHDLHGKELYKVELSPQ